MANDGIDVDLDDLALVAERVGQFLTEFERLGENTGRVADAVGTPAGDGRLRERVGDFESGWNGNREVVQDSLTNIRDHLVDFIETLREQDRALAGDG